MAVLDTAPPVNLKRILWERVIWVLDLAAFVFLIGAGIPAAFDPSDYVVGIVQVQVVIWIWGGILIAGGVLGFAGRLFNFWPLEITGATFGAWGAGLYAIILIPAVSTGSSIAVMALVLIALVLMVRRYAELKIFTSEPGDRTLLQKILRRTPVVIERHRY